MLSPKYFVFSRSGMDLQDGQENSAGNVRKRITPWGMVLLRRDVDDRTYWVCFRFLKAEQQQQPAISDPGCW